MSRSNTTIRVVKRRWQVLACLLGVALVSMRVPAAEATYRFNIEGQPLSQALQIFSNQSGLQIVFYTEVGEGISAPTLLGATRPMAPV